jgi:catechol 2,3-dioxygenase-like lactoylglutathione lyase family enzyme
VQNCRLGSMPRPERPVLKVSRSSVVPILRMYDVAATIRFYVDYLGCSLYHQDGAGGRPLYLGVSRDGMELHLSVKAAQVATPTNDAPSLSKLGYLLTEPW